MNKYLGFGIYLYLLSGKTYSAKFLSQKFEVSTKTIYRHINQLICAGFPILSVSGRSGGICLMDNKISINQLSVDEINLIKNSIKNNNSLIAKILLAKLNSF